MKLKLAMQLNNAKLHGLKSLLPYDILYEGAKFRLNFGEHIILKYPKELKNLSINLD